MGKPPGPRQGDLIWASVLSPQGERKARPIVLISSNDDMLLDREIVGVAVTTTFPVPTPASCVELPWDRRGHPATGLRRRSAAVCDWLVKFRPSDIIEIKGYVPTKVLLEILRRVSGLKDGR